MSRSCRHSGGKAQDRGLHEVCFTSTSLVNLVSQISRGRVVELSTNCYGCHVLQKALDCEEDIRLFIVSELLLGDPASTLTNKHASHVWSKVRFILLSNCKAENRMTDYGIDLDSAGAPDLCLVRIGAIA